MTEKKNTWKICEKIKVMNTKYSGREQYYNKRWEDLMKKRNNKKIGRVCKRII